MDKDSMMAAVFLGFTISEINSIIKAHIIVPRANVMDVALTPNDFVTEVVSWGGDFYRVGVPISEGPSIISLDPTNRTIRGYKEASVA